MRNTTKYGSLRLQEETLDFLRMMKQAFELSYCKKFTNDEFIKQMAASVEEGDVAVWEIFCELNAIMDEVKEKARQRRSEEAKSN